MVVTMAIIGRKRVSQSMVVHAPVCVCVCDAKTFQVVLRVVKWHASMGNKKEKNVSCTRKNEAELKELLGYGKRYCLSLPLCLFVCLSLYSRRFLLCLLVHLLLLAFHLTRSII